MYHFHFAYFLLFSLTTRFIDCTARARSTSGNNEYGDVNSPQQQVTLQHLQEEKARKRPIRKKNHLSPRTKPHRRAEEHE
jgi:hypothetical protein